MKIRLLTVEERFSQCCLPAAQLEDIGFKGYRSRRSAQNSKNPDFCMRHAKYEIDGKFYCSQHAGELAVQHLLT